uniref:Uncharacterized protein n=1 Tax=Anopheles atroparvus TaxID=41427 RepID=A0A182JIN2_ANOAO
MYPKSPRPHLEAEAGRAVAGAIRVRRRRLLPFLDLVQAIARIPAVQRVGSLLGKQRRAKIVVLWVDPNERSRSFSSCATFGSSTLIALLMPELSVGNGVVEELVVVTGSVVGGSSVVVVVIGIGRKLGREASSSELVCERPIDARMSFSSSCLNPIRSGSVGWKVVGRGVVKRMVVTGKEGVVERALVVTSGGGGGGVPRERRIQRQQPLHFGNRLVHVVHRLPRLIDAQIVNIAGPYDAVQIVCDEIVPPRQPTDLRHLWIRSGIWRGLDYHQPE